MNIKSCDIWTMKEISLFSCCFFSSSRMLNFRNYYWNATLISWFIEFCYGRLKFKQQFIVDYAYFSFQIIMFCSSFFYLFHFTRSDVEVRRNNTRRLISRCNIISHYECPFFVLTTCLKLKVHINVVPRINVCLSTN